MWCVIVVLNVCYCIELIRCVNKKFGYILVSCFKFGIVMFVMIFLFFFINVLNFFMEIILFFVKL